MHVFLGGNLLLLSLTVGFATEVSTAILFSTLACVWINFGPQSPTKSITHQSQTLLEGVTSLI